MNTRRFLTFTSATLTTIGVGLLIFYGSNLAFAAREHHQGLVAFSAVQQEMRVPAAGSDTTNLPARQSSMPVTPDQAAWSDKRRGDYESLRQAGLLDEPPQGVMRIPSISLEIPLFDGTEERNLTRGAGIIEGTTPLSEQGNTGLAAHRDGYFRSLKDVRVGDEVEVETFDMTYRYRVSEIVIVDPTDVHVLDPTVDRRLTLVTCYPFYFVGSAPKRYIVQADII